MHEVWHRRYGKPTPELPDVGKFLHHRSVRKYRPDPISPTIVTALQACAQGGSTSSNLQLWSAISVQDPIRRDKIAALCGDQKQVREAPLFYAFLADHHRLRQAALRAGEAAKGLDYTEYFVMAVVDATIAAERMACAAESMGLGCCYIGALRNDPFAVRDFFNLPPGVFGVFGLCLGFPEEPLRAKIKPRLDPECVFFSETYQNGGIGDFDDRMAHFYQEQKMGGDATWSLRSGKRVDEHHLTGREAIRAFLDLQGLALR